MCVGVRACVRHSSKAEQWCSTLGGIEFESVTTAGWTHRGIWPEHHEACVEEHGQPDIDNGAKRRVTIESGLGGAMVMGEQDEGIEKLKKIGA